MYRTIFALAIYVFLGGCMIGNNITSSNVSNAQSQAMDPNNPLLKERIVFLNGNINNSTAQAVCEKLVYLNKQSKESIKLVINSPGGDGTAFLTMANMIKSVQAPVDTINVGLCGSAGAMLFLSATGQRYALENSIFVIHDPKGGPAEVKKIFEKLQEDLFKNKAQLPAKWLPFKGKEYVLTAKQAQEYKMVDKIIEKIKFGK
jgi:ATP-dependent Clp protease, protease subunit